MLHGDCLLSQIHPLYHLRNRSDATIKAVICKHVHKSDAVLHANATLTDIYIVASLLIDYMSRLGSNMHPLEQPIGRIETCPFGKHCLSMHLRLKNPDRGNISISLSVI